MRALFRLAVLAFALSSGAALGAAPNADAGAREQQDDYDAALRALADGRTAEAAELLTRYLAKEPDHAGAWLDLAVSQCNLGNSAYALQLFEDIERRFEPPPGIRDVIATFRATGCVAKREREPVASWQVALSRGHDDNVNQGASSGYFQFTPDGPVLELDPDYLPHADNFWSASAYYIHPLSRSTYAIAQFYQRAYDRMNQQDSQSLIGGIEHSMLFGKWRVRGTALAGVGTLAQKMYQRQSQFQLRVQPPWRPLPHVDVTFLGSAARILYPSRPAYDGTTTELGALLAYRRDGSTVQGGVSVTRDDAGADRPGGDRQGGIATLQWYTSPRRDVYVDAGLTHQYWLSERAYAPGVIDVRRRQNVTVARASVQWYFRPGNSLQLEWRDTRSRDNIPLFQYRSRAVQLSLRWDNL